MAIWHFRIALVPSQLLGAREVGNSGVIYITEDEILKSRPWEGRILDYALFDQVAPGTESGSKDIKMWGSDRGNDDHRC